MARSGARLGQPILMINAAKSMNYLMRRTKDIRSDRRRHMVVMQSLRLMITSGVVRRAEMDPPHHRDDCAKIEADLEASLSFIPPVNLDEQGWLTRFFLRRTESPFTQARHTT